MELLLLILIVVGFISNILITRHLLKQIAKKIAFSSQADYQKDFEDSVPSPVQESMKGGLPGSFLQKYDLPTKNQIGEDENDFEFNEQTFSNLPKDVKIEVEGGDTYIPAGYSEGGKN